MTYHRTHVITPCNAATAGCAGYGAGHNTHTVQATLAGRAPRGWRHAVVLEIDGLLLTLGYAGSDQAVVVWHHLPLDVVLEPGSAVRLHELQALLEVDSHWVSVAMSEPFELDPDDNPGRMATCREP